jgi:hypothetical protein
MIQYMWRTKLSLKFNLKFNLKKCYK